VIKKSVVNETNDTNGKDNKPNKPKKKVQNHNENQNEKESKPTITKEVIQITPTNTTANPPTHTSTNDTGAEESIEYVLKQRKQQMEEKQKEPKKTEPNLPKRPDHGKTISKATKERKGKIMTLHDLKGKTKSRKQERKRRDENKQDEDEEEVEVEDESADPEEDFRNTPFCRVCLQTFEREPTALRTFGCGCLFHTECIDQWSRIKSKIDPKYATECPVHPTHVTSF